MPPNGKLTKDCARQNRIILSAPFYYTCPRPVFIVCWSVIDTVIGLPKKPIEECRFTFKIKKSCALKLKKKKKITATQ